MAAKPEGADAKPPAKSKKMLIIIIGVVLVLLLGGGAFVFISKKNAAAAAEEEGGAGGHAPAPVAAVAHDPKALPVYLPMDNMVVNLADPGGERVAQVGITLEVLDDKSSDTVKAYMPTIRSGVLMLLSQRTAQDLLSPEGKQKLIDDILREASVPFGGGDDHEDAATAPKKKAKRKVVVQYPVIGVLFSSLIVQ